MDHLLELLYSEHDANLLDVDLHMLQALLVVTPYSNFYTVDNVLFHKYVGMHVSVKLHVTLFYVRPNQRHYKIC